MKQSETNKNLQNLFKKESRFDINEIERVYNFIFKSEPDDDMKLNFLLYDGKYGSGKSYKLNKAIEYEKYVNSKIEVTQFDSFQSGFSDNFSYILLLEIFKNITFYSKVKKSIALAKVSSKRVFIVFPLALALTYSVKKMISPLLNFTLDLPATLGEETLTVLTSFFEGHHINVSNFDMSYLLLFLLMYIIVSFSLHIILTAKKGYTISNRDYYFNLILLSIGEVLIIDDFERLEKNQQKQIYEFLDYCNHNPKILEKSNLKTIVLVGSHEHIKAVDNFDEIQSEPIIDKYFKHKLTIESWVNTFEERIKIEHPNKVLNTIEISASKNLLSYLETALSRRNFLRFLKDEFSYYTSNSFAEQIIKFLNKENITVHNKKKAWSNFMHIIEYKDEFLDQFLMSTIPVYSIVQVIIEDKITYYPTMEKRIQELKRDYSTIIYFSDLLEVILDTQKKVWKVDQYKVFFNINDYIKFKERVDITEKLEYAETVSEFNQYDYYKIQNNINLSQFCKQIIGMNMDSSFVNPIIREYVQVGNLQELDSSIKRMIEYGVTLEQVEEQVGALVRNYETFCNNYIFSYIQRNDEMFDLESCEVAYHIANSENASKLVSNFTLQTDVEKAINYIIQARGDMSNDILAILVECKKISSIDITRYAHEFYKANEEELKEKINNLKEKNIVNYNKCKDNNFIDLNFLHNTLYNKIDNDLKLELFENVSDFNQADSIFDDLIKDHLVTFDKKQLRKLIQISSYNSQIYNRKMFKEQAGATNIQVRKNFKNYTIKQIKFTESGKVELFVPENKFRKKIKVILKR